MMKICVCGWYWRYPFLTQLETVQSRYPVFIVSHKCDREIKQAMNGLKIPGDIPFKAVPNVGLEWGAYDYYLKNIWDEESDVLFMHDDTLVDHPKFFDRAAELGQDQVFIFESEPQAVANQKMHGRCFKCSARFLAFMKQFECHCPQSLDYVDRHHNLNCVLPGTGPHTGFWFDPNNFGHNAGKPPVGVRHYNDGIYHFKLFAGRTCSGAHGVRMTAGGYTVIEELRNGKRGVL
jgi:hypothetical protein